MWKSTLLAVLTAPLLTGCLATGPETRVIDTACSWTRPIYISKADVLSDGTARQIVAHNETGKRRCGWKRTSK